MAGRNGQDNGGAEGESRYRIVIGDKNYSSWSLRPWLLMRHFGIDFDEIRIRLRQDDSKSNIRAHSPSGKVPALLLDSGVVWDSLAIADYLAEEYPDIDLWPRDPDARRRARSISAEMHAGFADLRRDMPMDWISRLPVPAIAEALEADIHRIVAIWQDCRGRHGADGPFLFGAFSIADAMYAPVASRFRTYGVDLKEFGCSGNASLYAETVLALPELEDWTNGARAEIAEYGGRLSVVQG